MARKQCDDDERSLKCDSPVHLAGGNGEDFVLRDGYHVMLSAAV